MKMCPLCEYCHYPSLSHSCSNAKIVHFVDNNVTVFFAVLMSLWGKKWD